MYNEVSLQRSSKRGFYEYKCKQATHLLHSCLYESFRRPSFIPSPPFFPNVSTSTLHLFEIRDCCPYLTFLETFWLITECKHPFRSLLCHWHCRSQRLLVSIGSTMWNLPAFYGAVVLFIIFLLPLSQCFCKKKKDFQDSFFLLQF